MNTKPIAPDEFEKLLVEFAKTRLMSKYDEIMNAYRAVVRYTRLYQVDDDPRAWFCHSCYERTISIDASPPDAQYCPHCGAYILGMHPNECVGK